jgi:anti-sigma regulatory factor (Ser/Thr protein kinase)
MPAADSFGFEQVGPEGIVIWSADAPFVAAAAVTSQRMLTLTVPADSRYVTLVRATATAFLASLGVLRDDIFDVGLVVGEACSNVVRHAYLTRDETYRVELTLAPGGVVIRVIDHGRGMDSSRLRRPDPCRPNGWGIWLVEHLAARVSIRPVYPSGTELCAELAVRYRDREAERHANLLIRIGGEEDGAAAAREHAHAGALHGSDEPPY